MEELKTKSELMAEMHEHADYINNGMSASYHSLVVMESDVHKNMLHFAVKNCSGAWIGIGREYRPDPVAPADGRAVIVGVDGKIRVSRGTFYKNGNLQTYEDTDSGYCGDTGWYNWCDYLNRDHHSPGWKKEWEPTE